MTLASSTRLGPYEILTPLGAGGMGEVYRAKDTRLGREVAIKVLPAEVGQNDERLRRFEQEARAASALNHPNILTVHDVGAHEGKPYLVTELLDGSSLRERLGRQERPPLKELLDWAAQIARGLVAAHARGIVHRDLKPENLFACSDGRIKILDFGLAKLTMPADGDLHEATTLVEKTESGTILGTVGYMSPEQVRGKPADARSDLFSLGCVLYEMLAGRRAFRRETHAETLTAILREEPEPLAELAPPALPAGLLQLVEHCLEKRPERRFQSARDLAFQLEVLSQTVGSLSAPARRETRLLGMGPGIFWLSCSLAILIVVALVTIRQFGKPIVGPTQRIESVAVLPLSNLSGDPQQDYFADGMTEAFINELGQLSGLRVISRTSVMQYRETKVSLSKIARDLKVDAVLEGSVLQAGDRVEITANLLEPRTEKRLWSKSYERDLRDILALRKEIARAIVQEIHLTITPEERDRLATARAVDPEAYRLYLRGNFHLEKLNEGDFRKALADYQQATEIDPTLAPAYAGMAMAYVELGSWFSTLPREQIYSRARAAALKAVELDEHLAEAHFALGYVRYVLEWNWAGADAAFRRGIDLNPRSSYGLVTYANYLTAMGRFEESILIARRAVDIDPLSPVTLNELSFSLWFSGRKKEAYEQIRKSSELAPDFPQTVGVLSHYHACDRNYDEAIREYQKLHGDDPERIPTIDLGGLGWTYGQAGRRDEALTVLETLNRRPETEKAFMASLALIHLGLGDEERSVEMLARAFENHETSLVWLNVMPHFEPLRDHPRFQSLVQRMDFP